MTNEGNQNPQAPQPPPRPIPVGDGGVVGELLPEARSKIVQCQQRQQQLVHQIGQIEVQKQAMLQQIADISGEAQQYINAEAVRLGIPDGVPWQITGDGKAVLLPQQGQMQPVRATAPAAPAADQQPAPETTELPEKKPAPEAPEAPEEPAAENDGDADPEGDASE